MKILKWFSIIPSQGPLPCGAMRSQEVTVVYDDDYGYTNTFPTLDMALESLEQFGYITRQASPAVVA